MEVGVQTGIISPSGHVVLSLCIRQRTVVLNCQEGFHNAEITRNGDIDAHPIARKHAMRVDVYKGLATVTIMATIFFKYICTIARRPVK